MLNRDACLATKESVSRDAPQTVGVYIFRSADREILYIGKSINLRARLLSHLENAKADPKEAAIVGQASRIECIPCESEFRALLLESQLIQKHKPRYNKIWRDDKSYLYVKVNVKDAYPRVTLVRRENDGRSRYFGPFPSVRVAESILKQTRRVIPFCMSASARKKPCFYAKLGLCAPCPGAILPIADEKEKTRLKTLYRKHIAALIRVLSGRTDAVIKNLYRDLKILGRQGDFEEAIRLRNRIFSFERFIKNSAGLEPGFLLSEDTGEDKLRALERILRPYFPGLKDPVRIECYDMSNLLLQQATAAMVVATGGLIDKSSYRKFRMKNLKHRSDFEMITEAITRRFRNSWPHPDLLVIDGGTPQVKTVLSALDTAKIEIPVIGIAKNPDRFVIGREGLPTIRPRRTDKGFRLIQELRDEAHRFSKKYHTLLRDKKLLEE
jgi:excinuclease ABC subunit C